MRRTSSINPIFPLLLAAVTLGGLSVKLTTARAQNGGTSNQGPKTTVIPIRPLAALGTVPTPAVSGINTYILNNTAAVTLGKALFWDMQTGSDGVQACATCHFNAGADSRIKNQVNPGQKAGDLHFDLGVAMADGSSGPNYRPNPGIADDGSFGGFHNGDWPLHKQGNVDTRNMVVSDVNDVFGSQGTFATTLDHIVLGSGVDATVTNSDALFSFADPSNPGARIDVRQATGRNTPSVINAVFNYRNFWDGRAQNTCNGVNPFGDRDTKSHLFKANATTGALSSTLVRLTNSSLCSQSLGPPLNNVEMSASNRDFKQLGKKLLSVNPLQNFANTTPLGKQIVDLNDSNLGATSRKPNKGLSDTYAAMIQRAFQPVWWNSNQHVCINNTTAAETIIDPAVKTCAANTTEYSQMEYNFSLFWGVAIQAYESTLRADQTPMDQMLAAQSHYTIKGNNVNNVYTIALKPGITPMTVSVYELNPNLDSSDQDVFAFDNGIGNIEGAGVTNGTIDYASGIATLYFDDPPSSSFPIVVSYSTGVTSMTQAQLHGLLVFNTKGRCITCHGGPELTNASVANVTTVPLERMVMGDFNIRVYDNGFYNIGVRPGSEDIGLHDVDPFGNPFSMAELQQRKVCANPNLNIMIPGRTGEFIPAAPLDCFEDIASKGNLKVPGLRNVALTAPYFHNGGQLTLEQVVEYYNRGGDFVDGFDQVPLIDPNIGQLGLTMDEKADLVDFLRNALTDQRVVAQAAPFDHPEMFLPNGHPSASNNYPVMNDPSNPGRAMDYPYPMMHLDATGKRGGAPINTFLQNLLTLP
jgi:cytochrome c peroxidase